MSDIGSRLDSLVSQFEAIAPSRVISRDFKDFGTVSDTDLTAGCFTVKLAGVENYQNAPGITMAYGTAKVVIYGQVRVAEEAGGAALEEAELLMLEDVQALTEALEPGATGALIPQRHTQSQQIQYPYGWIAVECDFEL